MKLNQPNQKVRILNRYPSWLGFNGVVYSYQDFFERLIFISLINSRYIF